MKEEKAMFNRLSTLWKEETKFLSSTSEMFKHPAYLTIIGMGEVALPFIFHELQSGPDHWFGALKAITQEDPVPPEDRGRIEKMAAHWLKWANQKGYVK